MPDAPQGIIRFPGLNFCLEATFTLSHGVTPSAAQIEILPQDDFPTEPGTLSIEFGDVYLEFSNCIVDQATIRRGKDGMISRVTILDRRWAWKFGYPLDGISNLLSMSGQSATSPNVDTVGNLIGSVSPSHSAQDIARAILINIGEENADVSGLPSYATPPVTWEFANPAEELNKLCEQYGCRVVLDAFDNISIQQIGAGAPLPLTGDSRTIDYGVRPPRLPDALLVVGGPTRYETLFRIRPVGEEMDGSIQPIGNLSYIPANGWSNEAVVNGQFGNVVAAAKWVGAGGRWANQTDANAYARSLARKTVYKWFQIYCSSPFAFPNQYQIQGCPIVVNALWQLLPIEDTRVTTYTDFDGVERPIPATVFGWWWDASQDAKNPTNARVWLDGHSIDGERGIVQLSKPAVNISNGSFTDPSLWLLVAHHVKDPNTGGFDRFTYSQPIEGGSGAGIAVAHKDYIVRQTIGNYDSNRNPTGITENFGNCLTNAQNEVGAALAEYQLLETGNVEYRGIIPISPDGAIQQVQWKVGKGGAFTTASRNMEFAPEAMAYNERRKLVEAERARRALRRLNHDARLRPRPQKGPLN